MKRLVRKALATILAILARVIIRKYRPKVVMVTGSVGKTSTKDALATILKTHWYVRASEKSYNSEFGVPFTIFGVKNPWRNLSRWFGTFKEACALILLPNHYPNLLILEVGADRPGDLRRILEIVTPDALIVTRLPNIPVHVEAYTSPEAVREEEFAPAYALPPGAPLIVNALDHHAREMSARIPAELITYGIGDGMVSLHEVDFYFEGTRVAGMKATVETQKSSGTLVVKGSVGEQQLLVAVSAIACAEALDVPLEAALIALAKYVPPPGRGRVFDGIKGSILLDDSYNSSPTAVEEALKTLAAFPHAKRRVAVLGDMLELGRYSVVEHERIGKLAHKVANMVVSVGIRARALKGARAYDDSRIAAAALVEIAEQGDLILIKGSQSIRMERIVEALLANPADSANLVRQEKEWKALS